MSDDKNGWWDTEPECSDSTAVPGYVAGPSDKVTPDRCCNCRECEDRYRIEKKVHLSDCSVHIEPAETKGVCDCVGCDVSDLPCNGVY